MVKKFLNSALLLSSIFVVSSSNSKIFVEKKLDVGIPSNIKRVKDDELKSEKLTDIDGNTKYIMFYDDNLIRVYDLSMENLLYESDTGYPFKDNKSQHCFIDSRTTNTPFICSDGINIWEPENELVLVNKNEIKLHTTYGGDAFPYDPIKDVPSSAKWVNNYEFFLKSDGKYGWNSKNTCMLISLQILFNYYDTFSNDDYIPEHFDYVSMDNISLENTGKSTSWKNWSKMPGSGHVGLYNGIEPEEIPAVFSDEEDYNCKDSRFLDYLYNFCRDNVNLLITLNKGITFNNQKTMITKYLNERKIDYTYSEYDSGLSSSDTDKVVEFIKKGINEGYPVIANGHGHSTVAFGYDDDYVYIDAGYGKIGYTPWSTYKDWSINEQPSALILYDKSVHNHSDNFYSTNTDYFYCSCGKFMPKREMHIKDLEMGKESNSEQKTVTYSSDFSSTVSYTNTYKTSANYIRMNTESSLSITYSKQIYGVSLILDSTYDGRDVDTIKKGDYTIQYQNSNGIWSVPLDFKYLIPYSYFTLRDVHNICIPYNFDEGTKSIKINVNSNRISSHLIIKRIILSIC